VPDNVRTIISATPQSEVASLPRGSFVLVMTHDHQIDFEIVSLCLKHDDFLGIGLIGSDTKRARFTARLRRLGLSEAETARMICPIGVAGIESKLPAAIAVAVTAQILQASHQRNNIAQIVETPIVQAALIDSAESCQSCVRAGMERCN
jgi:xanthine dehydrogenase accessory factor